MRRRTEPQARAGTSGNRRVGALAALALLALLCGMWAASGASEARAAQERSRPSFVQVMWERRAELRRQTLEHVQLTFAAMLLATPIAVGTGIGLSRARGLAGPVLGLASVIQTVPSLALLALMIPFLGIGFRPAVAALFLYALLPILRNTYTAIDEVDPALIEVGRGMGMTDLQLLLRVKIPLCVPVVMAGIRTSTVICVGIATLCTLIGAGGLGTMILNGLQGRGSELIFAGVLPAVLLALALDGLCALAQRALTPRGLRIKQSGPGGRGLRHLLRRLAGQRAGSAEQSTESGGVVR